MIDFLEKYGGQKHADDFYNRNNHLWVQINTMPNDCSGIIGQVLNEYTLEHGDTFKINMAQESDYSFEWNFFIEITSYSQYNWWGFKPR